MQKYKNKGLAGFTLTEVLMVLTVIGIIAVIAIRPLINNIQEARTKSMWKAAYQTLDEASQRVINDKTTLTGICADNNSNCLRNAFSKHLKSTNICDNRRSKGYCWHLDGEWMALNGSPLSSANGGFGDTAGLELNNGYLVLFGYTSPTCTERSGNIRRCGYLLIDTNGFKEPNTVGRDIFAVHLDKNGLLPYGAQGDRFEFDCGVDSNGNYTNGWGCARRVLHK